MVKWKRILYQTLLTWGILLGLDLLSSVLSRRGILEADVLSDVTSFVMMTGLIAVIQGCLVGFRKMYALVILPLLFVFIQLNLVVTLFTSTDPLLPEMSDELIALNGFLLCPFVTFHWPLRGDDPVSWNNILWCLKWTVFIGLYYWLVFLSVRRIMQHLDPLPSGDL